MDILKQLLKLKKALLNWGMSGEAFDVMLDVVKEEEGLTTQDLHTIL